MSRRARYLEIGLAVLLLAATFLAVRTIVVYRVNEGARKIIYARLGFGSPQDNADSTLSIAFIFQPEDCSTVLDVVDDLDSLWKHGVMVRGIAAVPLNRKELDEIASTLSIDFPLSGTHYKEGNILIRQLGYQRTPLAIVMGVSGEVRYVLDPKGFRALDRLLAQLGTDTIRTALAR